jgi:hypothetical protein
MDELVAGTARHGSTLVHSMSTLLCCIAAVGLHLASHHSLPGYNNSNPGVYVKTTEGYTAGTYYNSERRQTFYLGRTFEAQLVPWLSAGVTVGAITGYRPSPVLPMAIPSVRVPLAGDVSARVAYVPPIEKKGVSTVHFALEFAL